MMGPSLNRDETVWASLRSFCPTDTMNSLSEQKCWYVSMELKTGLSGSQSILFQNCSRSPNGNCAAIGALTKGIFQKWMKRGSALTMLYDWAAFWSGKTSLLSSWEILGPWIKRFWRHWHSNTGRSLVYEWRLWPSPRHVQIIHKRFYFNVS